jgi:hypothetical protein
MKRQFDYAYLLFGLKGGRWSLIGETTIPDAGKAFEELYSPDFHRGISKVKLCTQSGIYVSQKPVA